MGVEFDFLKGLQSAGELQWRWYSKNLESNWIARTHAVGSFWIGECAYLPRRKGYPRVCWVGLSNKCL